MIIFQRVFKLQSYRADTNMHKKHQKVLKRGLSLLYATYRHDLFDITVKHHQNIPNGIRVIERTRKCLRTDVRTDRWMDGRTPGSSLYPPNLLVGG